MSRVLFSSVVVPPAEQAVETWTETVYSDEIAGVVRFPKASQEIQIHDPRAFRSMSRASILLSNACLSLAETLRPYLETSKFAVGIYCVVENGPIDAASTAAIAQAPEEKFAETYRKMRNPKMYLKQLPNVVPAQLSIFLDVRGPMNVYTNSRFGVRHALQDAETDLQSGLVNAAIVCATHAFDDFLQVKKIRAYDSRPLSEGAAVLVLGKGDDGKNWHEQTVDNGLRFYGIASPLVALLEKQKLT